MRDYDTVKVRTCRIYYGECGSATPALLPVWLMTTVKEGKTYTFAVNGQTGKLTCDVPADKKKSLLWGGGVFAGTLGVAALILALMDALGSGSLLICAVVAAIVALAVVGALKGQLKQAAQQSAARGYIRDGSFHLDVNADHFLYESTTRRKIENNDTEGNSEEGNRIMGLIAAALNAAGGTLASQWKEYFYVDSLPDNVLATKAEKKVKGRFGGSRNEDDNVISDGSVIAVADGQCMMIVDQGRIVDFCAEPGEYVFDQNGEPSLFYGAFNGDKVKALLKTTFDRLSFGGQAGKDQRVYFFNTKEILGNKYGTPSPVPFRVVDNNIGLDVDISIRCFGEYSYRDDQPDAVLHQCLRKRRWRLHPRSDRQPAQERTADCASARICENFRNGHPLFGAAGAYSRDCRGA